MKKVLSVLLTAVMLGAIVLGSLCVSGLTAADVLEAEGFTNVDLIMDTAGGNLAANGMDLGVVTSTQYAFYGWHASEQKIVEYGYREGDKVVLGSAKFYYDNNDPNGKADNDAVAAVAGGLKYNDGESVRFFILVTLEGGYHEVTPVVKLADGTVHDMANATITYTGLANTSFFAGNGADWWPEYWLNPTQSMEIQFTTPNPFSYFATQFYANVPTDPEACVINIKLINEAGTTVEDFDFTVANDNTGDGVLNAGDGIYTVGFSRTHCAGAYTMKITQKAGKYFVLGAETNPGPFIATVTCASKSGSGKIHPVIVLGGDFLPRGDVNQDGLVNNKDVILTFKYVSGDKIEGFAKHNADLDGDGKITNKDVLILFNFATYPPAKLNNMSFNTVWVNGGLVCDVGDALGHLKANPIEDANTLGLRGWAYLDNSNISMFGYSIDGGEPVFDAAYTEERADVQKAFGVSKYQANGFNVNPVDVSRLSGGEHTITILAKAEDGTIVNVVAVPFKAAETKLLNVSYDELDYDDKKLFEGSVDRALAKPENQPGLNFVTGTVKNITVRGWARISEDVSDIIGFGYCIDDGEIVTADDGFIQDRAVELANAQPTSFKGGQGFKVVVPVEKIAAGEHKIDVYVLTKAGKKVKVVKDRSTETETILHQVGVTFKTAKLVHASVDALMVGGQNVNTAEAATMTYNSSAITILGWAIFTDGGLQKLVYEVDGERKEMEGPYRDRPDAAGAFKLDASFGKNAGFGLDTEYLKLKGSKKLTVGEHTINIIAISPLGIEQVIKTIKVTVTEQEPV